MDQVKIDTATATPVASPLPQFAAPMTVGQKRERWAQLLERARFVTLGDRLEYRSPVERNAMTWPCSPQAFAAADPVLKDAGLKDATVGEALRFFEMNDDEMHALSCNCGGAVTGAQMAMRLRAMTARRASEAAAAAPPPSPLDRFRRFMFSL